MKEFFRPDPAVLQLIIAGILLAVLQAGAFATSNVTLAWNPSTATKVAGYRLYYGGESHFYTNNVSTTGKTSATVSGLIEGGTYYFAVTAYDGSGLESPPSNEATYTVPLPAGNQPPTLNATANIYLTQNAGAQTVSISGISPGTGDAKAKLKVTAVSSNRKLVSKPKVRYAKTGSTATLTIKPKRNATGTTTITVTVKSKAKSNNLAQSTFQVTVLPSGQVRQAMLLPAGPVTGQFTVNISGMSGQKYVVQASTNLIDWVPVQTNAAPFTFTDVHAGEFHQRFYRSVVVP